MRKLMTFLLCITIIFSMGISANATYDEIVGYETTYEFDLGNAVHVETWANYLFVSTSEDLEIYDINTDSLVATWKFTTASIPSVGNGFKPSKTLVTDEYIVIVSTTSPSIAVFPNEGKYTDEIPAMIRRIGVFNTVPLIMYKDGYLYAVDRTGNSTINSNSALKVAKDTVVCWKIDLSRVDEFTYSTTANGRNKYSILNHADMLDNGYCSLVEVGVRDALWTDLETDGEYIYLASFNNTVTEPYKTLFADRIALEDFSYDAEAQCILEENYVTGMLLEMSLTEQITEEEVLNLPVYLKGGEVTEHKIGDYNSKDIVCQITDNTAGGSTVKLCIEDINAMAENLGCTKAELTAGSVLAASMHEGVEYVFEYNATTENRNTGALMLHDSKLYAFTQKSIPWGNRNQGCNYMMICQADSDGIELLTTDMVGQISGYTAVKEGVVVGDYMFGLMQTVLYKAYILDISQYPISNNNADRVILECGISGAVTANIELYGNRIYYPSSTAKKVGVVSVTGDKFTLNVKSDNGYIYGESLNTDEVIVAIDGTELSVSSVGGAYGVPVYALTEGTHTVTVSNGYDTLEETIEVSSEDAGDAIIFGKTEESVTLTDDPVNNIITISGTSLPNMPVSYELTLDGTEKATGTVTCDENGEYETTYDYSGDILTPSSKYEVSATTMAGEATAELSVYDPAALESALTEIKDVNVVADGAAFKTYIEAEEKAELAKALGLTIGEGSTYAKLNSTNKTAVMTEVYNLIKADRESEVKETFASKVSTTYTSQRRASARSEINSATVSTLKGILEKYRSEYGISDALWTKYLNNEDDWDDINKYFVKKSGLPLTDVSEVASKLSNAIKKGPDYYSDDDDDGGSFGSGGGGKISAPEYTAPVVPGNAGIVENTNVLDITFTDIDSVPWAKDSIIKLAKAGIVNGIGDSLYAPDREVTREEFTKMLVMLFGLENSSAVCPFKDVDSAAWYYTYIASAYENKITEGYNGIFGVGSLLTREEMTVLALRTAEAAGLKLTATEQAVSYTDSSEISDWARESVEKMQVSGIINGISDKMFSPKTPCTRAMAAKVIYTLLQQM